MTDLPTDPVDGYEQTLTRAVRSFSDRAVVPIDAAEIAHAAIGGAKAPSLAGRLRGAWEQVGLVGRLGTIAATGLLVVAGAAVIGGGSKDQGIVPVATATAAASAAIGMCTSQDVDARITRWEGAAGHRIATVVLVRTTAGKCSLDVLPQPWLADGSGKSLVVGHGQTSSYVLVGPDDVLHTLVQVGNYCGPTPDAPVTVAFTQSDGALVVAAPLTPDDRSGVPPCNGEQGPKDDIQMQPWSPD